jgi:hypothetical protein
MGWKFWDYVGEYFLGRKTRKFYEEQRGFYQEFELNKRILRKNLRRLAVNRIIAGFFRGISNIATPLVLCAYAAAKIKRAELGFPFIPLIVSESSRIYALYYSYFVRKDESMTRQHSLHEALLEQKIREREEQEDAEGEEWKNKKWI